MPYRTLGEGITTTGTQGFLCQDYLWFYESHSYTISSIEKHKTVDQLLIRLGCKYNLIYFEHIAIALLDIFFCSRKPGKTYASLEQICFCLMNTVVVPCLCLQHVSKGKNLSLNSSICAPMSKTHTVLCSIPQSDLYLFSLSFSTELRYLH